jgi:hypothetical protein
MSKPTPEQLMVLAGMFAVSNMGQKLPEAAEIAYAKQHTPTTAGCAISRTST